MLVGHTHHNSSTTVSDDESGAATASIGITCDKHACSSKTAKGSSVAVSGETADESGADTTFIGISGDDSASGSGTANRNDAASVNKAITARGARTSWKITVCFVLTVALLASYATEVQGDINGSDNSGDCAGTGADTEQWGDYRNGTSGKYTALQVHSDEMQHRHSVKLQTWRTNNIGQNGGAREETQSMQLQQRMEQYKRYALDIQADEQTKIHQREQEAEKRYAEIMQRLHALEHKSSESQRQENIATTLHEIQQHSPPRATATTDTDTRSVSAAARHKRDEVDAPEKDADEKVSAATQNDYERVQRSTGAAPETETTAGGEDSRHTHVKDSSDSTIEEGTPSADVETLLRDRPSTGVTETEVAGADIEAGEMNVDAASKFRNDGFWFLHSNRG